MVWGRPDAEQNQCHYPLPPKPGHLYTVCSRNNTELSVTVLPDGKHNRGSHITFLPNTPLGYTRLESSQYQFYMRYWLPIPSTRREAH